MDTSSKSNIQSKSKHDDGRSRRGAWLPRLLPWMLTAVLAAVAFWLAHDLYDREMRDPWTRDGQVTADLILMASPVSGMLEDVLVRSGLEAQEGDLLFNVRPVDDATPLDSMNSMAPIHRKPLPTHPHGTSGSRAIANPILKDSHSPQLHKKALDAGRRTAHSPRNSHPDVVAVRAPSRGWVIESSLQHGGMVKAGEPLFAFAVADSFRVTGFFRETHLRSIQEGSRARVTLMAWPDRPLDAVVENIGRGIAVSDGALDARLLPQVTPTFDWVRLARRFPVRVRLLSVPPDIELRVGLTASVQVLEGPAPAP